MELRSCYFMEKGFGLRGCSMEKMLAGVVGIVWSLTGVCCVDLISA